LLFFTVTLTEQRRHYPG